MPVDLDRLAIWMDGQGLGGGPIIDVRQLAGGTQNIILYFSRGGRGFVMRRPPRAIRSESNGTMRREARILAALAGTDVPHPGLIAGCGEEDVLGYAFYLMEPVDGFNATSGTLPEPHASDPEMRREMGLAIVDGAAALGRIDYRAVGLDGFGRPEGYLERQVARWRSQLEGYARYDGWPGLAALPDVAVISSYLDAHRPRDFRPGIIHGDYSLGNVMYRRDGPGLAAIIDWELATIGDPLIDLGWLLATWPGAPPADLPVLIVDPWEGFPSADDLVARYAEQSDRDLSGMDWYMVLACYKLAIILEGACARAYAGLDPMETGESLHATTCTLLERALHRIG